jgi:PIN domain
MPNSPKVYLESCCFIDLAKQRIGVPLPDAAREKEIWFCRQILRAGRAGDMSVYTSALTTIECLHIDKQYTPEIQRAFTTLLSGASGVIPVQPEIFVIERARDLRWIHKVELKPLDGMHVASALEAGCVELITTDEGIHKKMKGPEITALNVGLRAILASQTQTLPAQYRQDQMALKASDLVLPERKKRKFNLDE